MQSFRDRFPKSLPLQAGRQWKKSCAERETKEEEQVRRLFDNKEMIIRQEELEKKLDVQKKMAARYLSQAKKYKNEIISFTQRGRAPTPPRRGHRTDPAEEPGAAAPPPPPSVLEETALNATVAGSGEAALVMTAMSPSGESWETLFHDLDWAEDHDGTLSHAEVMTRLRPVKRKKNFKFLGRVHPALGAGAASDAAFDTVAMEMAREGFKRITLDEFRALVASKLGDVQASPPIPYPTYAPKRGPYQLPLASADTFWHHLSPGQYSASFDGL